MAQLQSIHFPAVSEENRWKCWAVSHTTYECNIFFNNLGSFIRKSEYRKSQNLSNLVGKNERYNVTNLSFFASFGEITMHMWFWQLRPTVYQQMQDSYWKIMALWDASQPGAIVCQPMQELTQQVMSRSCGNWILEKTKVHMQRSLR